MLSLIGFLMVIAIIVFLLRGKMSPIVVLIIVPLVAALLIGTGIADIGEMVKEGVKTVQNNSVLFIFSIIFFSVMSDLGVFDIIVDWLVKVAGDNIVAITVATGIIGIIAHLDGATATTVLITIPSMYPIYKRMNISPMILLTLTASAMGVMNLLPWGGPVARASTVLGMDATDLWLKLIPIQIVGIISTLVLAVLLGRKAKRDIEAMGSAARSAADEDLELVEEAVEMTELEASRAERHRKLLPLNTILTLAVIGALIMDKVPSYLVFMVGLGLVMIINYPTLKEQDEKFKEHAPAALVISATMLAAGVMVGIMNGTGMLEAMARTVLAVIPGFLGRYIHLVFGFTALPMGMMIGTDAYFYGILPLVAEVGEQFGVAAINTATTMLIGKNISLMISPLVPATFLSIGLVDVELKDHIRFSFKWLYAISIIMIIIALLIGVVQL